MAPKTPPLQTTNEKPRPERKRQARGEARIKSLLDAAEVVFARDGYSAATTNEIAAVADVSPATVYQFFKNKEEIANALAVSYAKQMGATLASIDFQSLAKLESAQLVNEILDPLLQFHKEHPAFMALLLEAPLSEDAWAEKCTISDELINQLATLLIERNSKLQKAQADWAAGITMTIYKGFMQDIARATGERREQFIATMKSIMFNYLQPML